MMNLTGEEVGVFNALLAEWQRHIGSSIRNEAYYKGEVKPVTTDSSMPKDLVDLNIVMGWGGKCVDVLANRSVLAGFDGEHADAMADIVTLDSLVEIYEQAVTSELTGTMESLHEASEFVRAVEHSQDLPVSVPEEIAWENGWITTEELERAAEAYGKSVYGQHLKKVAAGEIVSTPREY